MRRYIGYLIMCAAVIAGVGVSTSKVITSMETDLAYSEGKTLYFRASSINKGESSNGEENNYYGEEFFLDETDKVDGEKAIDSIATTFRARLDKWGLSEYDVKTIGYDTIAVSLRTYGDTSTQYTYLQDYLSFSGGDYELDATITNPDLGYSYYDSWATMLDGQTARIENIEMTGYKVPVVVVPLIDSGDNHAEFLKIVKYCEDNKVEPDESGEQTEEGPSIVVWANRNGEQYDATATDKNAAAKVVAVVSYANATWYASDEDRENEKAPSLQIVPSSSAISNGSYDPNKTKEAYEAAVYLTNKINASSYGDFRINFTYQEDAAASVENVVSRSYVLSPAMGRTLIATIVGAVLIGIVLAFFNRIFALSQFASMVLAVFASFATFAAFTTQFNIAALLGLGVVAIVSLVGSLYYGAKLKDELYKGRTLKKANQEAAKKALWPTIDAGVVSIIIGIFVYFLAGDIASKFGVTLVLGGFFATLINLIFMRASSWLLANDSTMQAKFPEQLGLSRDKLPDLAKEEKQTYFGPYANRDFTKGKKVFGIFSGLVLTAGIIMTAIFAATNGTAYNDSAARATETVLRLDVRSTKSNQITTETFSTIDRLSSDSAADGEDLFHAVKLNGKTLAKLSKGITLSENNPMTDYHSSESDDGTTYYWFFYQAKLNLTLQEEGSLTVSTYDQASAAWVDEEYSNLAAASKGISDYISSTFVSNTALYSFAVQVAVPEVGAPYLSSIMLALGIAYAVILVYLMIRFRPSRGIAGALLGFGVTFISVGFFAITRIAVAPIVSIGACATGVFALLVIMLIFEAEKDIFANSHEKEKNNLAFRSECVTKGTSIAAEISVLLSLLAGYIGLVYFGIGPSAYSLVYLSFIIGILFAIAASLTLTAPCSILLAKLFSKIHFKPIRRKKPRKEVGQLGKKKTSAEPEESIFIGIND